MTDREDRVSLVVEDCVDYWRRTGVPRSAVAGMREELEQHLHDALTEGKSVESVVGPNVLEFAEEWAREYRPASALPRPIGGLGPGLLALGAGILTLFALLGIAAWGGGTTIEVCCPPQRVEQGGAILSDEMLIWLIVVLGIGIAGIVASVMMFRGSLRKGAWVALGAAPFALLSPVHIIAATMLAISSAWAFTRARRAEAPIPIR